MPNASELAQAQPDPDSGFRDGLIATIPHLRAFAQMLCRNRDEANDICQEALVKAWQARASFEPGTNLKAWLFKILRNAYYSEKRQSARRTPWDEAYAETVGQEGNQDSAVAFLELARALRRLPLEQREALVLVSAGGVSYEEAARISGCAVGTIKSRIARARVALERMMAETRHTTPLPTPDEAEREIANDLQRLTPRHDV